MKHQKLHLGCGLNTPDDWLNVDGSWNAMLSKHPLLHSLVRWFGIISPEQLNIPWNPEILIHNVRFPLPFETGTFQFVYASHLLEHLYLDEGKRLLAECLRVLKPIGVLRMVVPDLKWMAEEYISATLDDDFLKNGSTSADQFNDRLLMHNRQPPKGNIFYRIYTTLNDFHTHKWMYDAHSLTHCFKEAGFSEVQEMVCHESRIAGIQAIEDPSRILQGAGICIEGIRPGVSET